MQFHIIESSSYSTCSIKAAQCGHVLKSSYAPVTWRSIKTGAEQHAQLNKYCGDPRFLARVEAFTQILNQVILLDVIWGRNQSQLQE